MANVIDAVLGVFSPHICKGCGKAGAILCENCIFDNIENKYAKCIVCEALTSNDNLCQICRAKMPFERAWLVGERKGTLKKVVGDFKYNSERGGAKSIAKLLDGILPTLPDDIVIIPIPTISPHIRTRGFGHTEIPAKELARIRGLKYDLKLLLRADNSIQHGLGLRERKKQAEKAFVVSKKRPIPNEVLLFDDIYTSGSTIIAATKLLKQAGVKTVNVAIIAKQVKDS